MDLKTGKRDTPKNRVERGDPLNSEQRGAERSWERAGRRQQSSCLFRKKESVHTILFAKQKQKHRRGERTWIPRGKVGRVERSGRLGLTHRQY